MPFAGLYSKPIFLIQHKTKKFKIFLFSDPKQTHTGEFDVICALKELFVYAVKYNAEIMDSLQRDSSTQQTIQKFGNLINYKF
jgi:hypothetical protein